MLSRVNSCDDDAVATGKQTAYEAGSMESGGTALVPVMAWELALTPHGRVRVALRPSDGTQPPVPPAVREAFERGAAFGLLHLGSVEVETPLPSSVAWWRDVARTFVAGLCSTPADRGETIRVPVPVGEIDRAIAAAPPMEGSEYLDAGVIDHLWKEMEEAARIELDGYRGTAQAWLRSKNEVWNRVGRVVFHLAENESDAEAPFAFLATYTDGVTGKARPAHRALGGALRRFAGAKNRSALLALLTPVQRAAEKSEVVRSLVQSGDLFHPIAMTAAEAHAFLKELPVLEEAGLTVRVPDFWKRGNPARPVVQVRIGDLAPGNLGVESLLSFDVGIAVGKHRLTEAEWKKLMAAGDGLVRIKGTWVELNRERLAEMMAAFRAAKQAGDGGVAFGEALRLLAGAGALAESEVGTALATIPGWAEVTSGEWLAKLLARMRGAEGAASLDPGRGLRATLREYQEKGVHWLWTMASLGMGACLADDMGLGKTIQVLGLIDALRRKGDAQGPHLLVAPATLLANWRAEIDKFMPDLRALVVHPSLSRKEKWQGEPELVLTSYGFLQKQPELMSRAWDLVVLDEAQAIKNPGSRTTKAVKALKARRRVALTGTPVENRLGDLWSLFDFLNPGLLGTTKQFKEFTRGMTKSGSFRPLRDLIRPYLLRRLKSEVLRDLPAKTEVVAWCGLTDVQAGHYARAVEELRHELGRSKEDPFRRSGVVLSFISRFKQICNHPAQWAGGGAFLAEESGKFQRLAELASTIAERQEKALVFTQFQEMTEPLAQFLATVFGREGLVLHGATPVATRRKLVDAFQDETGPPFFVISVKAGGTGLNLTAASHVIHFDRWWNPAVENQATDRAHRIGQKNPVLVHKFVCRGTVEDRIEALLQEKSKLSKEILEGGEGAPSLTQMSDDDLVALFSLDVTRALGETG